MPVKQFCQFTARPRSPLHSISTPMVLVEGDDDRRVLEQVVRSGRGNFSVAPCVVGSVNELSEWEDWLNKFLPALYDSPKAFSLRDLDGAQQSNLEEPQPYPHLFSLNC